jgi:membrane-associated protein
MFAFGARAAPTCGHRRDEERDLFSVPDGPVLTTALGVAGGWPVPVVLMIAGMLLVVESGTLIGIVIPGTTVLVALGLWSHAAPQALGPGILIAAVATVTGAHFGWWRGRAGASVGYSSAGLLGRPRQFAATRAAQAGHWLTERGPVATTVVLACAHWASAARPAMPRMAGAAGVPYMQVGPVLIVSGSAWAATIVLLANRVGALVLTSAAAVPIVVVVLVIGSLILHARWSRANSATSPDPRRSPQHQPCPCRGGRALARPDAPTRPPNSYRADRPTR